MTQIAVVLTFFVNLCLTNWTSPKAPLPMTLIKLKSSVFIRHCPISADTSASAQNCCHTLLLLIKDQLTSVDKGINIFNFPNGRMVTVWHQSLNCIQKTVNIHDGSDNGHFYQHLLLLKTNLLSCILSSNIRSLSFRSLSSGLLLFLLILID